MKLLITGGGGPAAESLWDLWKVKFDLYFADIDVDRIHPSVPRNKCLQIPRANSETFVAEIERLAIEMGIDVIISQVDEELIQLKKLESKLTGLITLSPSVEFTEMCLDKNRLGLMLQHLNISDPKTELLSNSSEFSGKVTLFKPQFGRGSRNIYLARNDLEFHCLKKYLLNQTEKFICQEYLNGKEYTVQMLSSSSGILNAIVPLVVYEKRGSTTHSNISTNMNIIQECKRVHEAFKPSGTYNIQLIHSSDDNRAYVIEINPRVSTTMCVSLKLGFDPVEIYLDESQDSEIKIPSRPLILRRYWNNVYF